MKTRKDQKEAGEEEELKRKEIRRKSSSGTWPVKGREAVALGQSNKFASEASSRGQHLEGFYRNITSVSAF